MASGAKPGERRGGRQKGTPNKKTVRRQEQLVSAMHKFMETDAGTFAGDAHALLMAIYKNPSCPLDLRMDAAKTAIRFEKPALASAAIDGNLSNNIAARIKAGRARLLK